jgi:hypothetical protein
MTLKAKLAAVTVEHSLVLTSIEVFGFIIQYRKPPSSGAKEEIFALTKHASDSTPLSECRSAFGLTVVGSLRYPKKVDIIVERMILFSKNTWSIKDKLLLKSGNQALEAFKCLKSIQNASPKLRILRYTLGSAKKNSWKGGFFCLPTITQTYCFFR